MSSGKHKCIPIYSFELNPTALPTDKFQLTKEHDQAQNNILYRNAFLFVTLILYEGIQCENLYSLFDRIQYVFSQFFEFP